MVTILIIIFILIISVFEVFKILINTLILYSLNVLTSISFPVLILKVFNSFNTVLLK